MAVKSRAGKSWPRMAAVAAAALLAAVFARPATVSPLFSRGYTVIPEPQQMRFSGPDFRFGDGWQLVLGQGVKSDDVAVQSLREDLEHRFHVTLAAPGASRASRVIRLAIQPRSVSVGAATDANKQAIAEEAYSLSLAKDAISITANAPAGLFYGVETLVQLVKSRDGALWLPQASIVDWPDLEYREIYWDDAHHLDHLDVLKRAVRQAAFFKINGFAIKLEGHFEYKSAPAIVEPYALSPAKLQELTDYGLRYHVQVVPYLDGPAHIAFILKHPEYAALREYAQSNYELCTTNPDSYKLLTGMYQDLLDANKGVKYFHLSTDEPYYVGLADNAQCREAARAKELGSVGKLLAEFLDKTAGYLHDHGRTVIFWGEEPLKPEDVDALPKYLVNGETYGPQFDPVFKAHGIREMIYVSTEGVEQFFPNYYILPSVERLHPRADGEGRVAGMFDAISYGSGRRDASLIGMVDAGWADEGLHPETFWLGYVTGAAAGWHPGSPDPGESMSEFYSLFYGPSAVDMGRLYQLMSTQAQFYEDSWESAPSTSRTPIFGNSYGPFSPPRPAHDRILSLPAVPAAETLALDHDWSLENARRLELASKFLGENDELLDLIRMNLERAEWNHYNLEVYLSIAHLDRQNLQMLLDLGRIDRFLQAGHLAAEKNQPARAVAALDRALGRVQGIRAGRNRALHDAVGTWTKSWYPRVAEANGRRFLHELDDVKDHGPDRTVDMSYLVYCELILPLGDWAERVQTVRNQYAQAHGLPVSNEKFDWKDTASFDYQEAAGDDEEE